jgi:hypothetical protein
VEYPTDIKVEGSSVTIKTDTDTVPYLIPYYVKTYLPTVETFLDYVKVFAGELFLKWDRPLYNLNFFINDSGELEVIGDDAAAYSIDVDGNLIYSAASAGIGYMAIGSTFIVD